MAKITLKSPNNNNNNLDDELIKRIDVLERKYKFNENEIKNLDINSKDSDYLRIQNHFESNLVEIEEINEICSSSKINEQISSRINKLYAKYRINQNNYINKKIEMCNLKLDMSVSEVSKRTNEITGNLLFSVIGIFLGVSLVSSMTTAINKMESKYYLPFFITIVWSIVSIIGISYMLLNESKQKNKVITLSIISISIVLIAIFYCCFKQ